MCRAVSCRGVMGQVWAAPARRDGGGGRVEGKPSTISTATLHALLRFHGRPIQQVVFLRSYSVWQMGGLILGGISHLDAFSASRLRS